jgi:hypothetical protein
MDLKLGAKIYKSKRVKTRALRQAIEINEKIDFNNLKTADLDELIDFICKIYGDKFNRDDLYDNLYADELSVTLENTINGIVEGATDRLETFPEK